MKIFKVFITLGIVLLGLPSALAMTTSDQIDQIDIMMANNGYSSGSSNYGRLDKNTSTTSTLQASAGKDYFVVSVCDTDCRDIDVQVTDKYGDIVGKDADSTDMALVQFRANYSGTYTVKTTMYNCQTRACHQLAEIF